ncbi:MAG TPA: carbamoyltransferase C-terminal domain-containing protein [Acetobacteraceae bacterium]|nr:carbamoyltransferase C-terminal domain-containing protein [Acetobacteraceae bacterium]
MLTLGIAGLANVTGFLEQHFPEQMAKDSRVVQGMDAAAALLLDGRIIAAASEERFDRNKKSGAFPFQAIRYCLNEAGATLAEVSDICCNFNFGRYRPIYTSEDLPRAYWQKCLAPDAIFNLLKTQFRAGNATQFHPIDHHDAHLHAALASCEFEQGLGVVMDAAGEIGATSVYHFDGPKIMRLARYPVTQSLGLFYSLVTQFLGYAFNEDEYKVMGLASFGDPQRYRTFFRSAIRLGPNGSIEIPCLTLNRGFTESLFFTGSAGALAEGLGIDGNTCSHQERADLSAALQERFREALFHICGHYRQQTRATNLLLSGGCAENCAAIGELRSNGMFERIHVAYASGDEGTALGAAAAHVFSNGAPLHLPGVMPFFGPAPRPDRVRSIVAQDSTLALREFDDEQQMLDSAAADIAADKIVALCHGRMEYGARALGNRSLLALPAKAENKDRINLAIKKRQNYRPFAPAVAAEDAHRYFVLNAGEEYPYMTMLTHVREEAKALLPAVTHVDGTARVQTVCRDHNAAFYYLLSRLKALTGVPVVLNTSYNVNHQPIVCTEEEALDTFLEMGIDALYIANARVALRDDPRLGLA